MLLCVLLCSFGRTEAQRQVGARTPREGAVRARSREVLRVQEARDSPSSVFTSIRRLIRFRPGLGLRQSATRYNASTLALWLLRLTHLVAVAADKRLVERLLRKISPSLKNTAATHNELVSMLQICTDCRTRVTFCGSCARKAMAFFSGYTSAELQAIYAQDLPPANEEQVDAFAEAIAYREFLATHEPPTGRELK